LEKCHTDPCKDNWGEEVGGKGWKEKKNTTQKHNQKPTKTLIVSLKAAH